MVMPPDPQKHRLRSPPMFRVPVSVSVRAPVLVNEPLPLSWIEPLTVVERLLLPTMSRFVPSLYVPAPSIEPAEMLPSPSGPEVPEKSTVPPALVMKRAFPPLLLLVNCVNAPPLVVMVALLAVLVSVKDSKKPPVVRIIELIAELSMLNVDEPIFGKIRQEP